MQTNINLLINIVLLVAVIVAISRVIIARRRKEMLITENYSAAAGPESSDFSSDDIIAVRKIDGEDCFDDMPVFSATEAEEVPSSDSSAKAKEESTETAETTTDDHSRLVMLFLLAKENIPFAGYDFMQTLLSAGLRYGDDQLFHRYQHPEGTGPLICSLAAATDDGTFDMQQMGSFSERGLCLYMHTSGNSCIDKERFEIMLETASVLKESYDCYLLDDKRQNLDDKAIAAQYASF